MAPTNAFYARSEPNRQEGITDFGIKLVTPLREEGLAEQEAGQESGEAT